MTGTAKTEADEFFDIYKLEVVEIPTNMKMIRNDYEDEIYRTLDEKYNAIIKLIESCREKNNPVWLELYQLKNQRKFQDS